MIIITECLIYICFSLLTGGLLFATLSPNHKPDSPYSKGLLLWSTGGIGVLSFFPVLSVILSLSKDLGIWLSFKGVMTSFVIGKAWLILLAIALLLFLLIYFNPIDQDPILSKLSLILSILLIGIYAKSGHAASLSPIWGFVGHFVHLLGVSLWGGCLLIAAWRSKSDRNWLGFLRWFSPFAILSILLIIAAGFLTMVIDISPSLDQSIPGAFHNYQYGLVGNYTQALLIKHLLLIPLILLAFFNGFYTRYQMKKGKPIDALKWARLESVMLIGIFIVTAFMGQQTPPHDVSQLLHFNGENALFHVLYGQTVPQTFRATLQFGMISVVFIGFCILFLILVSMGIVRRLSAWMVGLLSAGYLISAYLAIMLAIQ